MMTRMNRTPDMGDAAGGSGTAEAAAPAPETGAAQEAAGGSGGAADAGGGEPPQYDIAELEAKDARGEELTKEELDFYRRSEEELLNGTSEPKKAAQPEEGQQQPDEPKPTELPEWQAAAMGKVGAKTPEEVPEKITGLLRELSLKGSTISGFQRLVEDCKAGNQIAIHRFREIYGFEPGAASSPAPAPMPPQQTAPAQNGYNKDMFFDPEEGDRFLGEFGRLKAELAAIRENFGTIEQKARQKEIELDNAKFQSVFTDEICEVAELFREDFGLGNVPMRSAIEQLVATGSLGEKDVMKPFADYLLLYAGREPKHIGLSLKEYYKLLNFDKVGGKIAQAKLEAAGAARKSLFTAKQNRGAATAAHSAPSVTESDLQRIIDGDMRLPDEFRDEDGEADPRKMPRKLAMAYGHA